MTCNSALKLQFPSLRIRGLPSRRWVLATLCTSPSLLWNMRAERLLEVNTYANLSCHSDSTGHNWMFFFVGGTCVDMINIIACGIFAVAFLCRGVHGSGRFRRGSFWRLLMDVLLQLVVRHGCFHWLVCAWSADMVYASLCDTVDYVRSTPGELSQFPLLRSYRWLFH